jgi:hypothetical protein
MIREDFCSLCLTVPLAFAGVGASTYGSSSRKSHKRAKKIAFWSGVATVILSIIIATYFLLKKEQCKECQ